MIFMIFASLKVLSKLLIELLRNWKHLVETGLKPHFLFHMIPIPDVSDVSQKNECCFFFSETERFWLQRQMMIFFGITCTKFFTMRPGMCINKVNRVDFDVVLTLNIQQLSELLPSSFFQCYRKWPYAYSWASTSHEIHHQHSLREAECTSSSTASASQSPSIWFMLICKARFMMWVEVNNTCNENCSSTIWSLMSGAHSWNKCTNKGTHTSTHSRKKCIRSPSDH